MLDEGVVSDMLTESVGLKLVPLAGEKVGVAADGPELISSAGYGAIREPREDCNGLDCSRRVDGDRTGVLLSGAHNATGITYWRPSSSTGIRSFTSSAGHRRPILSVAGTLHILRGSAAGGEIINGRSSCIYSVICEAYVLNRA